MGGVGLHLRHEFVGGAYRCIAARSLRRARRSPTQGASHRPSSAQDMTSRPGSSSPRRPAFGASDFLRSAQCAALSRLPRSPLPSKRVSMVRLRLPYAPLVSSCACHLHMVCRLAAGPARGCRPSSRQPSSRPRSRSRRRNERSAPLRRRAVPAEGGCGACVDPLVWIRLCGSARVAWISLCADRLVWIGSRVRLDRVARIGSHGSLGSHTRAHGPARTTRPALFPCGQR